MADFRTKARAIDLLGKKQIADLPRLIYICNISQEYAQRMANEAFSSSNRVGVSFANTHE